MSSTSEDVLKDIDTKDKKLFSKRSLLIMFVIGLIAGLIDLVLVVNMHADSAKGLNPSITKFEYIVYSAIMIFILLPVAALLFSFLIALVPMRGRKYSKKYPSLFILLCMIMQVLLLISNFISFGYS